METQIAYEQYLINAQNENNFMLTILWLLFISFVIAPIVLALIGVPVMFLRQPRCPDCGSRRLKTVMKKIPFHNTTTLESFTVCASCEHESQE